MHIMSRRLTAIAAVSAILVGCTPPPPVDAGHAGPYPENYKAAMADYIKTNFFDPYTLRDVKITKPFPARNGFGIGWGVCLTLNAKNRMGGYIGLDTDFYIVTGSRVEQQDRLVPFVGDQCAGQVGEPWPEMDSGTANAK
jgi:hypothetical protein